MQRKKIKRKNAPLEMFILAVLIAFFILLLMMLSLLVNREKNDVEVWSEEKITVIIDAGHGGEDGGTSGANGILEKDLNLDIAEKLNSLFEAAGIKCVMTRTDDRLLYDPLSDYNGRKKILDMHERVRIAGQYEDSIFVSIHMNAFPEEKYKGLQVYYSVNNPDSSVLAEAIQSTVASYLQPENKRKIKPGKDIFLLDRLKVPCVLIECGFLSNQEECALLSGEEYRDELSFWIFYSIMTEIQ